MDYGHSSAEYRKYLKSKLWDARKALFFSAHPKVCEACGARWTRRPWWKVWVRKNWIVLHHKRYGNQRSNPGHEPDDDLAAVCRFDHEEIHARHKAGQFGDDFESLARATDYVIGTKRAKRQRQAAKRQAKLTRSQNQATAAASRPGPRRQPQRDRGTSAR